MCGLWCLVAARKRCGCCTPAPDRNDWPGQSAARHAVEGCFPSGLGMCGRGAGPAAAQGPTLCGGGGNVCGGRGRRIKSHTEPEAARDERPPLWSGASQSQLPDLHRPPPIMLFKEEPEEFSGDFNGNYGDSYRREDGKETEE